MERLKTKYSISRKYAFNIWILTSCAHLNLYPLRKQQCCYVLLYLEIQGYLKYVLFEWQNH